MTVQAAPLQPGMQLAAAASAIYQTPANTTAIVKRVVFTNTDTAARTITIYRLPANGTPGAANTIISAYTLAAGQDYSAASLSGLVLAAGESLSGLSDAAGKVNVFASGFTTTP